MSAIDVVIVPHTHWDREWYLPLEGYRHRLTQLMERLLELLRTDTLPCFVLDGQTAAVEDWLARAPHHQDELTALVRERRLVIGPWFVLADEFLVSGEALIRNLLEGRRVAEALGGCSDVAYSPDPFGHVSQLPQIAAGFGLHGILFARGIDDTPTATAYRWEGPDGTRALAGLLVTSYSNGRLLTHDDDAVARIEREVERIRPHQSAPVALICAGSDHEFPDPRLRPAVDAAAERLSPWSVRLGTFGDYFDALSASLPARGVTSLPLLRGELRGARLLPLLPGVLSAHMPLKQANDRCQDLLEGAAEPLSALAHVLGGRDPRPALRDAWRELLLNHAHDSICGCSVDAVHRENAVRFLRVQQMGTAILDDATRFLASLAVPPKAIASECRVVLNPLPTARTAMVEVELRESLVAVPHRSPRPHPWRVVDAEGRALRAQVLSEETGEGVFPYPSAQPLRTTRLRVECPLPPLGLAVLQCMRADEASGTGSARELGASSVDVARADADARTIENGIYRVRVGDDGTLCVEHRASGQVWEGLAQLESQEDAGDTYNFSPAPHGHTVIGFSTPPRITVSAHGPLEAAISISGTMRIPAGLTRDRKTRSRRAVTCPIQIEASVQAGVSRVDLRVTIDNRARDHRLRLRFPLRDAASASWAESAFDLVTRSVDTADGHGWIEDPTTTHPQKGVCFIPETPDATRGLALIARGLPEYEVVPSHERAPAFLALTLLRCVGWLSREDIPSRRCQAGPKIATPDAQCQGTHVFHVALAPQVEAEPVTGGRLLAMSRSVAVPAVCVDPSPPVPWGQESWPWAQGEAGVLTTDQGLLSLDGDGIVMSALVALDANSLLLRFYSVSDTPTNARLTLHGPLATGWRACCADFAGTPLEAAQPAAPEGMWQWETAPRAIVTVRLSRA